MAPAKETAASKAVEKVKSALGGTEVVTIDGELSSDVVLAWFRNPDAVPYLADFKEDPETVARRITAQQLDADSAEALFGDQDVMHAKDHIGKSYQFLDVKWAASDIEGEGLPIYGVFSVANQDGEVGVMTCGARSVVLKLAKADAEGWLPLWLKITKTDKPTPAGYFPLDIVSGTAPHVGKDGSKF